MKIGVLGTGMVGRAQAERLAGLGHDVQIGTRNVQRTTARKMFRTWMKRHPRVKVGTFADAARHGQVLVNAIDGQACLAALKAIGLSVFAGKTIIELANAVDWSDRGAPRMLIPSTDSLAERIQRALPQAKVVKTLNFIDFNLQVRPRLLARGEHDVFISGNDPAAKRTVTRLLKDFGWKRVINLGALDTARAQEALILIWIELYEALRTSEFGFRIVK